MNRIDELVELLNGHRVFIQTHNYPDPDAIASAYGLKELLDYNGIEALIVYDGSLGKISGIRMVDYFGIEIFNVKEIDDMSSEDYIVIVDAQKYNKNCTDLIGDEVACIDHHPTAIDCQYKYSDIRMVGACSTLIAEYYMEANITPSVDVATALVYGIKMDTAEFGRGVTELDVEMYYRLFPYSDRATLEKMQLNNIEFEDLKAYGAAISNITVYGNIGFAVIPFDCPDGLIGAVSDFILALDVVEFCAIYSVREGGLKFSVRSEVEGLDAGKIMLEVTKILGGGTGGGHPFMAGGFIPTNIIEKLGDDPRKAIEDAFKKCV